MSDTDSAATVRVALATDIVAAYLRGNHLPAGELPGLIRTVHGALVALDAPPAAEPEPVLAQPSAAEIRRSVTPDAVISFIDGKPYRTLKRHLTANGLDALSYRRRYGLPHDYPMVAPNYAKQRSDLAKAIGLGRPAPIAQAAE